MKKLTKDEALKLAIEMLESIANGNSYDTSDYYRNLVAIKDAANAD